MSKVLKEQHILREDRLLTFDDSNEVGINNAGIGVQEPLISCFTASKTKSHQLNPKTRTESIQLAVHNAYLSLGVQPTNSRAKLHIQIRSAIGVALSAYYNTYEIGAALKRDRSSVSHYTINHSQNLKYWEGYRGVYETVKEEIDSVIHDHVLELNIETLRNRIEKLQSIKQELIQKLKEKNEATQDYKTDHQQVRAIN